MIIMIFAMNADFPKKKFRDRFKKLNTLYLDFIYLYKLYIKVHVKSEYAKPINLISG